MIVFVAGATFNILFAFLLACIVWIVGQPVTSELTSTTVAEVLEKIENAEGTLVPSPASQAGLKAGDVVIAVDGEPVTTFEDITEHLALSSGWSKGQRETIFRIKRGDETLNLTLQPVLSGNEKTRKVGFRPARPDRSPRRPASSPAIRLSKSTAPPRSTRRNCARPSARPSASRYRSRCGATTRCRPFRSRCPKSPTPTSA